MAKKPSNSTVDESLNTRAWAGILRGILANQPVKNIEQVENVFFSNTPFILEKDESDIFYTFDGIYSHKALTASNSIETLRATTTYGRLVVPFTSRGEAIDIAAVETETDERPALAKFKAVSNDTQREIFSLTFWQNGQYTFTQTGSIDHYKADEANDSLNLFLSYTLNNRSDEALMVRIHDDAPLEQRADTNIVADDTYLSGVDTYVNEGDEALNFGTDGPADADNAPITIVAMHGEVNGETYALTSHGVVITVVKEADPGTLSGYANDKKIFTFAIDAYGSESFTQFAPIDHPDTEDHNDSVNIVFDLVIKDYDGDETIAQTSVQSNDDGPRMTSVTTQVDETDKQSISGNFSFDFGQDGPSDEQSVPDYRFNGFQASNADGEVFTLTHHDAEITSVINKYDNAVTELIGQTEQGDKVFTLTLQPSGDYQFSQHLSIDHPDSTDPDDVVELYFGVDINGKNFAQDYDGDRKLSGFSVQVFDDKPSILAESQPVISDIHEQDGYAQHDSVTGDLQHGFGFDGPALSDNGVANGYSITSAWVISGDAIEPLTSNGDVLSYVPDANQDNLLHGMVGDRKILSIAFDPQAQQFTYTQFGGIDHPADQQRDEAVDIRFDVQLTDADGDSVSTQIGIDNIIDGAPVAMHDTDKTQLSVTTHGNVISGEEPDSAEGLQGNLTKDGIGSDAVKLRAITHAGITYTLSDDGLSVAASDGASAHTFNNETGELTLTTGLGGELIIDLLGDDAGAYAYTAPETIDLATQFNVNNLPEGMHWQQQSDGQWTLNLGGRLADNIVFEDNANLSHAYCFGNEVAFEQTANVVNTSAEDGSSDQYAATGIHLDLDEESLFDLGNFDGWHDSFIKTWDVNSGSFGGIDGGVTTIGGYKIKTPFGNTRVPKEEIDTRFGIQADLGTSGEIGIELGFDYTDFNYDADLELSALLTPGVAADSNGYYQFNSSIRIDSQDVDLNPSAWEAWMDLILKVAIDGGYEARIPYEGDKGNFDKTLIDADISLLSLGLNGDGMLGSVFGLEFEGIGETNNENFGTVIGTTDPDGMTSVERFEFDLPSDFIPGEIPGVYGDLGKMTIYNYADLTKNAPSKVENGVIKVDATTKVFGLFADIDGLMSLLATGGATSALSGGSFKLGRLWFDYDLIDLDLGPVFGVNQSLKLTPKLQGILNFSQPVYVENHAVPVRSVSIDDWENLPAFKPLSDDPVTVTPALTWVLEAHAKSDAVLDIDFEMDLLELDLKFDLGVTAPNLAGIGPLYTYDENLAQIQLDTLFDTRYDVNPASATLTELPSFAFPQAPNPVPTLGMDRMVFSSLPTNLTINLVPDSIGKEYFSYVLEDGDGDQSQANLAITILDELPEPTRITISDNQVNENLSIDTVVAHLSAYSGDSLLTSGLTFTLSDDADIPVTVTPDGRVLVDGVLDFETAASWDLTVSVSDRKGQSSSATFALTLNDVNDLPVFNQNELTIDENQTGLVGQISATDPDGDSLTYSIIDESGLFTIDATSGVITLNQTDGFNGFNYEEQQQVFVTVSVTDGIDEVFKNVPVVIADVNEGITGLELEGRCLFEHPPTDWIVGVFNVLDEDNNDGYHFDLSEIADDGSLTASDHFYIDDKGNLRVQDAVNFSLGDEYHLQVTVTDNGEHTWTENFAFEVLNATPIAVPDYIHAIKTETLTIPNRALLYNDIDFDNEPLVLSGNNINGVTFDLNSDHVQIDWSLLDGEASSDAEFDLIFDYQISDATESDTTSVGLIGIDAETVTSEGVVTILGSENSDILIGTFATETLQGKTGRDVLIGSGGADTLQGGDDDDLFLLSDANWTAIDGGEGLDTLGLYGATWTDAAIDLSSWNHISNIEIIDLSGYGANALTVNPVSLAALSGLELIDDIDSNNIITNQGLFIHGDADDSVSLERAVWLQDNSETDESYDIYSADVEQQKLVLIVQTSVDVSFL